ncbi:hypothetical protein ROZALSC1DRAFT_29184 [Rozella allomycis CSF55]|uniref:Actin interacting protein 3 domain-containing protein n=1 Tax=Rozella allomycis (strain CSF55) TaxID=988480 RepID=A0A075AMI2_ROZAC|nr:Actin interacting protein 3 domain-containing protein [Rozella allomycis CSF55]RKP19190.1 hypothetical protein ROZALSC1DRAFT_29184 [Rozella allomycis CSF55]|eukprot:EPZ30808.1 Actin interacting protein 3 domain-containing protein [Rozella allomycis CSF55]
MNELNRQYSVHSMEDSIDLPPSITNLTNDPKTPRKMSLSRTENVKVHINLATVALEKLFNILEKQPTNVETCSNVYTEFASTMNDLCLITQDDHPEVVDNVIAISSNFKLDLETYLGEENKEVLKNHEDKLMRYKSSFQLEMSKLRPSNDSQPLNLSSAGLVRILDDQPSPIMESYFRQFSQENLSTKSPRKEQRKSMGKTVFLKLRDLSKTVQIEESRISKSSLQLLFIEHFGYSPMGECPPITVTRKDGDACRVDEDIEIQYEKNLLIKDTENLAQLIEQGFSILSKDIRDIRKSFVNESTINLAAASSKSAMNSKIKLDDNLKTSFIPEIRHFLITLRSEENKRKESLKVDIQNILKVLDTFKTPHVATKRSIMNNERKNLTNLMDSIRSKLTFLQEAVEEMKKDVTQRKIVPNEARINVTLTEALRIQKEISSTNEFIDSIKSNWKKIWETELQVIVGEQQALKDDCNRLADFEEDHEGLIEVIQSLQQIAAIKATIQQSKRFIPPKPDENFEGLDTVLQEIAAVDIDSNKRLKAIEISEKIRRKEQEFQEDPFEKELKTFVGGSRLQKTGNINDIERKREEFFKEMFKSLQ